jgi:hypothetical protein
MKKIFSLRRHGYLKTVGVFLIAVALIAGVVGCEGEGEDLYTLTMEVDPPGSGEAIDVTGAAAYEAGTAIDIQATANSGFQFVNWTASDGTFVNANAIRTVFTMPAKNVIVTAKFVIQLDLFKCYHTPHEPPHGTVFLEDQFVAINASLNWTQWFCNPAAKVQDDVVTPIKHPDHHLTIYNIYYEGITDPPGYWEVEVDNQFGTNQKMSVEGYPWFLAVPTQKLEPGDHNPPLFLDHFLVYRAMNGEDLQIDIGLNDEFGNDSAVSVRLPMLYGIPCRKTHDGTVTAIKFPETYLVFYLLSGSEVTDYGTIQIDNQFGLQELPGGGESLLVAVPSEQLSAEYIEFED